MDYATIDYEALARRASDAAASAEATVQATTTAARIADGDEPGSAKHAWAAVEAAARTLHHAQAAWARAEDALEKSRGVVRDVDGFVRHPVDEDEIRKALR